LKVDSNDDDVTNDGKLFHAQAVPVDILKTSVTTTRAFAYGRY